MFCGKGRLSVSMPTRNPQGFGLFSPSAGAEQPLRRGRTALLRGADRDPGRRTSLEDVDLGQGPALGHGQGAALLSMTNAEPLQEGVGVAGLSWPRTRDQRPAFPPSWECSRSRNPKSSSEPCWENPPDGNKWGCAAVPSPAERARPQVRAAASPEHPAWLPCPLPTRHSTCSSHHALSRREAPPSQQLLR